jgi:zinc protease
MRNRHFMLAAALAATLLVARADQPAVAAARAAGPTFADTLVSQYDVAGINVIQRLATGGNIVALQIHLLGGARQIDSTNAGIEPVMLIASESGTRNYPGVATRRAQSLTGSDINVDAGADWTTLGFVGLASEFDSTLAVVGDRLANPALDSAAVAVAKNRALMVIRNRAESPQFMAQQLAESLAFAGHPYANSVMGTSRSLSSLTAASVAAYHKAQVVKSRLLVVVAGNVTRAQVEAGLRRSLAGLPQGNYVWSLPERWVPTKPAVAARRMQLPTSYLVGVFSGPQTSNGDVWRLQFGMSLLSGMINGPMRDSGITYGAGAGLISRGATGGIITVSTGSPERAMRIINDRIELLGRVVLPPGYFTSNSADYNRGYQYRMETAAGQVETLTNAYLQHGDFRYFEELARELRTVTAEGMSRAVRSYVKNIQWAYIGDTTFMPRAMMMKY